MSSPDTHHTINFFNPRGKTMRREVRVIMLVLVGWLSAIIGFQLAVLMLEKHYLSKLNDLTFFNLPLHFWLTGQLLPLWFILLCVAFNIWMDRHTLQGHEGALRFRMHPSDQNNRGE